MKELALTALLNSELTMTICARAPATPALKTTTKFLNAAEEVFGRRGYEGTTIRAIANKAGVNLGALKHYWGSKQSLFRSLLERGLRPFEQEHMRRMMLLEVASQSWERLEVREVLATLIEPGFFIGTSPGYGALYTSKRAKTRFHMLYGRALVDPSPVIIAEMSRIFEDAVKTFLSLLRRACPELTEAEFGWRVNCIAGAQLFTQVYDERIGRFLGSAVEVGEAQACDWVLKYLVNGFDNSAAAVTPVSDGAP